MKRGVLWLLLLTVAGGISGMAVSVLAVRPTDPRIAVSLNALPEVSRHAIPAGTYVAGSPGVAPHGFWLVRDGAVWHAFADRDTFLRGCPLQWQAFSDHFVDPCEGSVWDSGGRALGGPAYRNLDEFLVSETPDGYVTVDPAQLKLGAAR